MNEEQLRQAQSDMNRAELARQVQQNPAYVQAITAIRASLFEKFSATNFSQSQERDEVWRKMQVVDWLERELADTMKNGRVAQETKNMLLRALRR